MGLSVLLVEQKDFAWGTSSRSSKLVHGGLRYLKEGRFLMTKIAVSERERLLKEAPGLVESLGFLLPIYEDQSPSRRTMQVGLSLYDIMARERQHHYYDAEEFIQKVPHINPNGLKGGFHFLDAQVDDARLVLRLINESVASGACALNYLDHPQDLSIYTWHSGIMPMPCRSDAPKFWRNEKLSHLRLWERFRVPSIINSRPEKSTGDHRGSANPGPSEVKN